MSRRAWLGAALVAPLAALAGAEPPERPAEPDAPAVSARPPVTDAVPGGPDVEQRLAEIQRRVRAAVAYPAIARREGIAGETRVSFEIAPDGRPLRIETAQTSGSVALDRAAVRAVEGAAPLPWIYGRVTVPVRFALRDEP